MPAVSRPLRWLAVLLLTLSVMIGAPIAAADPSAPADPPSTASTTDEPTPSGTPTPTPTTEPTPSSTDPTGTEPTDPTATTDPTETTAPPTDPPTTEPPPFSEEIDAASPGQEELAAQAISLSRLVFDNEEQLARLELEAEAVADTYRQAEVALKVATAQADLARLTSTLAEVELQEARADLRRVAREIYINGGQLANDLLLLDSESPANLIERAGLLEAVASNRSDALERLLVTQERSEAADEAALEALEGVLAREAEARAALEESTAMLDSQRARLDVLLEQKAEYEAEFYAALVELLGPEGAAAAFAEYEREQQAQNEAERDARAAAYGGGPVLSGEWALPLEGTFTSCFCERWGTMHWGIDIAAPMYTPIYSAGDGVVLQAGPATGFGQAVYIQHDNGDVTVYGHMEVIEVATGQRVSAGQEIALVGTQGFSTGPHLHFEVMIGGMNGVRVDPVIWLANRGIFV